MDDVARKSSLGLKISQKGNANIYETCREISGNKSQSQKPHIGVKPIERRKRTHHKSSTLRTSARGTNNHWQTTIGKQPLANNHWRQLA